MAENLQQFIDTLKAQLAEAHTQVARLEGELAEARRHWKRCEQGWNRVILQAEGFQRANAALAAALNRHGFHPPRLCSIGSGNPPCYYCEPALSDTGEGWLRPEVREQDIEAAICFAAHSKSTHENWTEWLGDGGDAPPEAGGLEHHRECVQEYEHIIMVLRAALDALKVK